MSVFISYSTKDSNFIDKLSTELIKNRIQIWLDKWEMQPGDSLIDKIQNALTESSFLLVVLSKHSVESEWCKKELNSALMREIKEKKVVVIPILLEDCEVPIFLQEKVYADFRNKFNVGFTSLLKPLSKLFSEHMGRNSKNEIITDYAINWGIDEFFFLDIDFISWYEKDRKSILLQIKIIGCEKVTERFIMQNKMGMSWLMKETIMGMMFENKDFRDLKILVENNKIYDLNIKTQDIKLDLSFTIKIRAVLMGEDNNNDILIHLIDFLAMLDESKKDRMK